MIGKLFLGSLITHGSVQELLQFGQVDHLFRASEEPVYEFVSAFVKKYQELPTLDTVEAHTDDALPPAPEPPAYYYDLLVARFIEFSIRQSMKKVSDLLQPENKDPDEALKIMAETAVQLIARRRARQVVDFRDAYVQVLADYTAQWKLSDDLGLMTGWPTLDNMTGGLRVGDVLSMIARPGLGKTQMLLTAALYGWKKSGKKGEVNNSRMFVSMEMGPLQIQQRLIATQLGLPAGQIKKANLSTPRLKKLKAGLTEIKGYSHPFYVVDGNLTATVEDIWMLARQLKPAAIFVDGAYLLKHPTERDRYRRVAENSDLIKSELAAIAPTFCSWQFARSQNKKGFNQNQKPGLEDIAYADAIGQVSSVVLALLEGGNDDNKSRVVSVLKGRSGETGDFRVHWDWEKMLFHQIVAEDVSAVQIK